MGRGRRTFQKISLADHACHILYPRSQNPDTAHAHVIDLRPSSCWRLVYSVHWRRKFLRVNQSRPRSDVYIVSVNITPATKRQLSRGLCYVKVCMRVRHGRSQGAQFSVYRGTRIPSNFTPLIFLFFLARQQRYLGLCDIFMMVNC